MMSLAMPRVKEQLRVLRENNWYITAFPFCFANHDYAVVFEDLREIDRGTKYFAVCLTFIDQNDNDRRLEVYVNSYGFNLSDEVLIEYFGILPGGYGGNNVIWQLYNALNEAIPETYEPIREEYVEMVLHVIDHREHDEGFCCYMARHNGRNSNNEQIYRSAKNTAKTRLRRPTLFNLLGDDPTISFCYRQEGEEDDATIVLALRRNYHG